jgi:anti-sigma factor RsiW
MKDRFDELLPFYVNGTLPEADREFVETYLREHPKSLAELSWYRSLQDKLKADVPAVSSEVGLDRTMARIRAERGETVARRAPPRGESLGERVRGWLAAVLPQPMLKPALAGALAVVVVQAVVIGNLATERDDSTEMRAVRPTVVDKGPWVKVNFKADARETDIRLALVQVGGSLTAGPSQLGDWYVRLPEGRFAAALASLKASPVVESAVQVDALPERR